MGLLLEDFWYKQYHLSQQDDSLRRFFLQRIALEIRFDLLHRTHLKLKVHQIDHIQELYSYLYFRPGIWINYLPL